MASQSVFAQTFKANQLYLGFQNQAGAGQSDYIIDLGDSTNIVGGTSVVTLSTYFSLSAFNSVLGSSTSMFGGVVGGLQTGSGTADLYLTQSRSGGAGTPSVPGSDISANMMNRSAINGAASALFAVNMPTPTGAGTNDTFKTWENNVEPANGGSTFLGNTGLNPDQTVSTNAVLYEDLYTVSSPNNGTYNSYSYLGYFTLDLTGSSPILTFTPKNTPGSLTAPVIVSVSKSGGTVTVVSSNAVPTHNYQLQYTASLSPVSWNTVGSAVSATGTMVTNSDSTATPSSRFYRVQGQ